MARPHAAAPIRIEERDAEAWTSRVPVWSRLSLRAAFAIAVLIGLLVPSALIAGLNFELRREQLQEEFRADMRRSLEVLSIGMRQPLWDLSRLSGRPLLDSIMRDPRIVSVTVTSNFSPEPFLASDLPERRRGQVAQIVAGVDYEHERIGEVALQFDDSALTHKIEHQRREYLLLILAQLLASVGLIWLLIDHRFLRPLQRIGEQADALACRALDEPFRWTRADEIGLLGRRLEQTRQALAHAFDQLYEKQTALEQDIAEREHAEQALRASESRYRALFVANLDAIVVTDLDGRIVEANPSMQALADRSFEQLVAQPVSDLFHPAWYALDQHIMTQQVLRNGHSEEYELELLRPDGRCVPVSSKAVLLRDETGTVTGIWRILRDQTERRAAAARMELAARVLDATQEAILVTNGDLDVVSVNPAFCDITGYTAEEIVGQSVSLLRSPQVADADYDAVYGRIMADADWQGEQPLRRRDGSSFIAALQVNSIRDLTGRVLNIVVLIRDVTADKATQARILHLARFDPLTGLPNRAYFQELVEEALQAARRRSERCALVFVDLDHFKTVNDSLGHAVGDALLKEVAARLTDAIRAGDTAGRLGGDEFVVLMRDVITPQDASLLARRVLERLAGPAEIAGNPLVVTPSLGIALFPDDGEDYDTLTRNADAAMYHAKERGRNNFQFYAAEMNARAVETLSVEAQLRGALERREFALHYQPQVDLKSGRIVGVEALLRWRHPEWGDVPPDRFIPVAEERGLIGPIGDWVLHEACRQAVAWQRAGLPPIVMAVNISAPQFYKQDLPTEVAAVLNETGLEARWLELEVTESLLMQDVEAIIPVMNALKQMGVGIGIDDFGTGYSSLGYLKRFKAGKLKIDRSFVADLPGDPDDCAITRAVIALGRSMNLKVIAEGVERPDQWAFLRDEGCDEAQGFLIARGLPPEALHAMLARGQWSGEDR